jgi:hypothetical protein
MTRIFASRCNRVALVQREATGFSRHCERGDGAVRALVHAHAAAPVRQQCEEGRIAADVIGTHNLQRPRSAVRFHNKRAGRRRVGRVA